MEILDFVFQTLLGEFVIVVVGVLFANFIKSRWEKWRYGGWRVQVQEGDRTLVNREVSAPKAKEVLEESADLAVFLKGVVSPYALLNCDLVAEGRTLGLLVIDKEQRRFVIDLDRNPPPRNRLSDGRPVL